MSIPKEPRQLMINIMYLVLTALLALNVSAEVFNAFKMVDKGLVKSNKALDDSMTALPEAIRDGAKTRPSLAVYADRIDPIKKTSDDLVAFLEDIKTDLIEDKDENGVSRGGYIEDPVTGLPKLKMEKDYAVTTRILIDPNDPTGGKGNKLKAMLEKYRTDILKYVDKEDQAAFTKNISVQIDEETWQTKGKASWAHMNFDHMPLQAVLPIFSKFINDVKSTEASALNYLAGKVGAGGTTVVLDKYTVVSAPEKSYIIKGEKYKTDIFLSAAAGDNSGTKISYAVNGKGLRTDKDGNAIYEATASRNGANKYTASASLTDPVTGETKTFKKEFSYEVGERSMTVSASKMNVFYIGVDNPVEVSAAGVNSQSIKVNMTGGGGTIKKSPKGGYIVNVKTPTKKGEYCYVTVSADGLKDKKPFRVKRIPDPVPKLSKSRGGSMSSGEFKIQPGVFPVLENFDFEASCKIAGYRVVRVPKRDDPQVSDNPGGKYNAGTKALIGKAKPSDKYFFENIRCKCPGDSQAGSRDLGSMVFNIK